MEENLVIVESPAKAKTIEKFLGKDFKVVSCYGHIRDLSKNDFSIDVNNNYKPSYIIPEDKKKIVSELKKLIKKFNMFWLATDEDREGEAIAWHLYEVLQLNSHKVNRIAFHEITKTAVLKALENPRNIDFNLVNAQQARRILDRIVGYELSPVLWKKVKPGLSAGRVQSVAVRLIVEREREILNFKSTSSFKVNAKFNFYDDKNQLQSFKAELNTKFDEKNKTIEFLNKCLKSDFKIDSIVKKPLKKSPPAPFTTSTLQQEASRKLGFSVAQTMTIAQRLYESGKITYMRTDSVNLSNEAINAIKDAVINNFGKNYLQTRQYTTKTKGAQEAHEAIRPTYVNIQEIDGNNQEKKLYELIWKRTLASQMTDAEIEKTTATISLSNTNEKFIAIGEVIKFDGFLKLYYESPDDEDNDNSKIILPALKEGQNLTIEELFAAERFTHYPPRYTEATLVRKLEELGIGRPSTYAPIISTIQQRGYVIKEDRPGTERKYLYFYMKNNKIIEEIKTENTGYEKNKLYPNDIAMVVNDFLIEHFTNILDFNFTANVEKDFDEIAEGKIDWTKMIDKFYKTFHPVVEKTITTTKKSTGERVLGIDPVSKKPVMVKIGRYGPIVQIGDTNDEEKPKFASLPKGLMIETITLEQALNLFTLPRNIGKFEDKDIVVSIGRFGPYIRHNNTFYSLKKGVDDPYSITYERAIEVIAEKREKDKNKYIKKFEEDPELQILNGRWGPYITYKNNNYKIPKNINPAELTYNKCIEIIKSAGEQKKKKKKK
jgi:DNA topoisomerase-1